VCVAFLCAVMCRGLGVSCSPALGHRAVQEAKALTWP
jgi:hypothetical protein